MESVGRSVLAVAAPIRHARRLHPRNGIATRRATALEAGDCFIAPFEMVSAVDAMPGMALPDVDGPGVIPVQELGSRSRGGHGKTDVCGRRSGGRIGEVILHFLLELAESRRLGLSNWAYRPIRWVAKACQRDR